MSAATLPRLLKGTPPEGPVTLPEHVAAHGPRPAPRDLIAACADAGLLGRGGALFPTAVKLRAVAEARGRRFVVVNAAEGEPMSGKDRMLLERVPHLVLDGALAAADAVRAAAVVVALPETASRAVAATTAALAERREDARRVQVALVPDAFLAGEETALIQALSGRPLRPTRTPPRPSERGLRRRATLVQNAETLAHLALIARHGPAWFRALGTERHPGSALFSVGGFVRVPGVYEFEVGTALTEVIRAAGLALEPARAVLIGGYHGTWVDADRLASTRMDRDSLAAAGLRMGAGVVVVLPQSACPVAEASRVMRWLASQTAGQCGPCVHGLRAIAAQLEAVRRGRSDRLGPASLRRWSDQVQGRGACHHPDGSVDFLRSSLDVFEPELEMHRRFGPCEYCGALPILHAPVPGRLAV